MGSTQLFTEWIIRHMTDWMITLNYVLKERMKRRMYIEDHVSYQISNKQEISRTFHGS